MKAKVLIPFRDKETKKECKKGDVIEITEKRFKEITKQGKFIALHKENEEKKPASKA